MTNANSNIRKYCKSIKFVISRYFKVKNIPNTTKKEEKITKMRQNKKNQAK